MKRILLLIACLGVAAAQDEVSLTLVSRIKTEAFDHSKVMDHLSYLTDVYGPRLTASPEYRQAADWATGRLKEYGLANVHMEKWPFGRSWSLRQFSVEMTEPRYRLLNAVPLAWSSSTNGPITGELIVAVWPKNIWLPKNGEEALQKYKKEWTGKLRGKIVLLAQPKELKPSTGVAFKRYTDAELADEAKAPEPFAMSDAKLNELKFPEEEEELSKYLRTVPDYLQEQLWDRAESLLVKGAQFFHDEGVLAVVPFDDRSHNGMVFAEAAGSFKSKDAMAPPTFTLTAEDFNRIGRVLDRKVPVKLRLNLQAEYSNADADGLNILGEIPGTGAKKDEIVMVGAHFDSWHSGTGATDNGAGSAVMIEVMRILKSLNLKLDRTVRIGLWGGEEQGYYGSRAYVKEHLGDPKTMKLTAEHAKFSGYFNFDNGSGKIRGVYLQGNDAMRPLFERWLAPFHDLGVTTVSIRDTGGTDHLSFDAVGLPGFQFIQDPLDYDAITHHGTMDTYDHAVPADLMQSAAVIATLVCDAANRPDMLPRKEPPKPQN